MKAVGTTVSGVSSAIFLTGAILCCVQIKAQAQTDGTAADASQSGASQNTPREEPPARSSAAGFFSRIGDSVSGVFNSGPATTQLSKLKPGKYALSNEAVGDERDIAEQSVKDFGLINIPSLTVHANRILEKLKSASGVSDVPGQVLVSARSGLEAGSTADGNIVVSLGWFGDLSSDDELAALLGHELGHVLLRHHDSNLIGKLQKQFQTYGALGIQAYAMLDKAGAGSAVTSTLSPGQRDALMKMDLLVKLTDGALHPAWNRRQEFEADKMAIDLVQKAGYSYSNGVKSFLEKVRQWDAQQEARRQVVQEDNQRAMQQLMARGDIENTLKQGLNAAASEVVQQLGRTHEGGDKRIDEAQLYVEAMYPDMPKQPAQAESYTKMKNDVETSRILKAYQLTFDAKTAIESGSFTSAVKILEPLTSAKSAIGNDAVPNYLMYEALKGAGRDAAGLPFLNRSFNAPRPAWKPFALAADSYKGTDPAEVARLGQLAMTRFKQASAIYPLLVGMYARNGQPELANKLMLECALSHPQYRDDCSNALKLK